MRIDGLVKDDLIVQFKLLLDWIEPKDFRSIPPMKRRPIESVHDPNEALKTSMASNPIGGGVSYSYREIDHAEEKQNDHCGDDADEFLAMKTNEFRSGAQMDVTDRYVAGIQYD